MSLKAGSRLGPYEILGPIGKGGMGEVYNARDTRLGRDVAIKVLAAAFAQDADRLARFEREAKAVAALSHPNILAIYDVGHHDGQAYVVTELLDGETLRARLTNGALPVRRAIDTAIQIARGLAASHDKAIIHRDLKPENVFLTKDGQVKILDFGLARQTSTGSSATETFTALTDPGVIVGTVGYMSPEQVRGQPLDARADLFALGTVLYEMLSGQSAFRRNTAADTLSAILNDDPPDLTGSRADLSPALDRVVRHCLEKNVAARFQTARDVVFALEMLSGTSVGTSAMGGLPAPSASRFRRALLPAAALVAVALAAGLFLGRRMAPGPDSPPVFEQKTFGRQLVGLTRFMPNGETIVYSRATNGLRSGPVTLEAHGTEPPSFSNSNLRLFSVSAKGELAVGIADGKSTLARMSFGNAPRAISDDIRSADWAPDGETLAVARDLRNGRSRLEYPIGTTLYEATGGLGGLRVAPDGSQVAFLEYPWTGDNRGSVKVVDRSGNVRTLAGEFWGQTGLAWTPDGTHVVYSVNQSAGYSEIRSVAVADPTTDRVIMPMPGVLVMMDIAPDGRWLISVGTGDMVITARVPGEPDERDLSWMNSSLGRALSADGTHILLTDLSPGKGLNYATDLRKTDGSPVTPLGEGDGQAMSPDGKWAAAVRTTAPHLVLYPTGTGKAITIPENGLEQIHSAAWFPDGQSLLVAANEHGAPARLYRQPMTSAAPVAVTEQGVYSGATLAPSGHSVIVRDTNGQWAEYFLEQAGRQPRTLSMLRGDTRILAWSHDSRSVFVQNGSGPPWRIERVDLTTGARTHVRDFGPTDRAGVVRLDGIQWVNEGRAYAYSYVRQLSKLFVVTGPPRY